MINTGLLVPCKGNPWRREIPVVGQSPGDTLTVAGLRDTLCSNTCFLEQSPSPLKQQQHSKFYCYMKVVCFPDFSWQFFYGFSFPEIWQIWHNSQHPSQYLASCHKMRILRLPSGCYCNGSWNLVGGRHRSVEGEMAIASHGPAVCVLGVCLSVGELLYFY